MKKTEQMEHPKKEEDLKNEFLAILESSNGIASTACEKAGIDRSTYFGWLQEDPFFADQVEHVYTNIFLAQSNLIEFESKLLELGKRVKDQTKVKITIGGKPISTLDGSQD